MLSKFLLLMTVSVFCFFNGFAQANKLSVKGGIGSLELLGEGNRGPNFEIGYSKALFNDFSIGLNHGYLHHESYPDFYQFTFNPVNGVPPKVDEYILSLNMSEGMHLEWQNYDLFYFNLFLEYYFLRILNWELGMQAGAVIQRRNYANFTLKNFTVIDDRIVEYTPWFMIGNEWQLGGSASLMLEKQLFNSLYLNVDFKYQYLKMKENENGNAYGSSSFGALRIGVSKKF